MTPNLLACGVVFSLMVSVYSQSAIYGVNVGGWLVLESWIVPSLFKAVNNGNIQDEWTWGQYGGSKTLLQNHWDTWLAESDLEQLQSVGITHLRIPIGYWIVCTQQELQQYNETYITGSWPYLTRAIAWAKTYGLKVLIDLHGAPGSQNGFDNSGRAGAVHWGTGDTIARTITYLQRIAQGIIAWEGNTSTSGVVVGLELINEPAPWLISGGITTIRNFYLQAYPVVRKILDPSYWVVIQQGFVTDWQNFMPPPAYENVYLDMHIYHAFSPTPSNWTQTEQITATCTSDKVEITSQTLPTFTGEWSLGVLNSYSQNGLSNFYARWGLAQMNAYEANPQGKGWFFWNFKTESSPEWNYLLGVQSGWFPKKLPSNETNAAACYWWCNTDCCLVNTASSATSIQSSLSWACSNGIDCSLVNSGGVYYQPNDLNHHASYAFNEWWALHHSEGSQQSCNFDGTAVYCPNNCAGKL